MKQHGALLAKGRLLGIQFDTLFTDNLYLKIAKNAIEKAEQLKAIFKEKNYKFFLETEQTYSNNHNNHNNHKVPSMIFLNGIHNKDRREDPIHTNI